MTKTREEKYQNIEIQNKKLVEWFNRYQDNISVEFMQGEDDPQQALIDGVCLALVHRFAMTAQRNPTCEDKDLGVDAIYPIDRLRQAAYGLQADHSKKGEDHLFIPKKLAKSTGFEEEVLFTCLPDKLCEAADMFQDKIQNSNGVLKVFVKDHALAIQIDKKHGMFRFYDPNIGIVRFKPAPGETADTCIKKVLESYMSLQQAMYSETKLLFGIAMHNK